jgi:hypothetical protein
MGRSWPRPRAYQDFEDAVQRGATSLVELATQDWALICWDDDGRHVHRLSPPTILDGSPSSWALVWLDPWPDLRLRSDGERQVGWMLVAGERPVGHWEWDRPEPVEDGVVTVEFGLEGSRVEWSA